MIINPIETRCFVVVVFCLLGLGGGDGDGVCVWGGGGGGGLQNKKSLETAPCFCSKTLSLLYLLNFKKLKKCYSTF